MRTGKERMSGKHVTLDDSLGLGHSTEAGKSSATQRHRQQPRQLPGATLRTVWSPRGTGVTQDWSGNNMERGLEHWPEDSVVTSQSTGYIPQCRWEEMQMKWFTWKLSATSTKVSPAFFHSSLRNLKFLKVQNSPETRFMMSPYSKGRNIPMKIPSVNLRFYAYFWNDSCLKGADISLRKTIVTLNRLLRDSWFVHWFIKETRPVMDVK